MLLVLQTLVYHTFLHHSQTSLGGDTAKAGLCTIHFYIILKLVFVNILFATSLCTIHFYIILKHPLSGISSGSLLVYHTFLHHSQTDSDPKICSSGLVYHTFLHHSQTSNSKMKCHHLHKIRYSNHIF